MFIKGNLIRLITEDGDAPIVRVIEDQMNDVVEIELGSDLGTGTYVDANDYEFVDDDVKVQAPKPSKNFTPSHSIEQIHEELELLMVQMVQYYQASEVEGRLTMRIQAETYGTDPGLTVEYVASIGYGNNVTTRRLDRSVKMAIERAKEDKALAPIEITFQGRDAA